MQVRGEAVGALEGKVAVVTGGGTGIGAAVARRFAAEGASVVVCGRRAEPLERVAAETGALPISVDVTDEASVAGLFRTCEQRLGGLDVLINNAGVPAATMSIELEDMSIWDRAFEVNVRGAVLCIKYAVPLLRRQGGAIVNVASDSVLRPKAQRAAYAASKRALTGLTEAVAQEIGVHGIRVNTLSPGATDTEMLRQVFAERAAQYGITEGDVRAQSVAGTALRRLATPEEIAAAALFLASDASSAITGAMLVVDAGRR